MSVPWADIIREGLGTDCCDVLVLANGPKPSDLDGGDHDGLERLIRQLAAMAGRIVINLDDSNWADFPIDCGRVTVLVASDPDEPRLVTHLARGYSAAFLRGSEILFLTGADVVALRHRRLVRRAWREGLRGGGVFGRRSLVRAELRLAQSLGTFQRPPADGRKSVLIKSRSARRRGNSRSIVFPTAFAALPESVIERPPTAAGCSRSLVIEKVRPPSARFPLSRFSFSLHSPFRLLACTGTLVRWMYALIRSKRSSSAERSHTRTVLSTPPDASSFPPEESVMLRTAPA